MPISGLETARVLSGVSIHHKAVSMNNEELTIRFADVSDLTDADYEELAALSRAAFSEYKQESNLDCRGVTMSSAHVRAQAEGGTRFVIAYKDGAAIAYGGSRMVKDSGTLYMHGEGLACHPEYRRLHLGWKIAQLKEDWGREQGAVYFDLDTSCKAAKALAFHKKNGYKVWAYVHHGNTNYYSVVLQKDVTIHRPEWRRYLSVVKSWIRVHLSVNEAGAPRPVGSCLCRIIRGMCHLVKL